MGNISLNIDTCKVSVRDAEEGDKYALMQWFMDADVLMWHPMGNVAEIEDSVRHSMGYCKIKGIFTAEYEGIPMGMANLYVNGFAKIKHQALFSINVRRDARGQGIGSKLLAHLIEVAQKRFGLELLHLEVYDNNPAMRLYRRFGFTEYGRHKDFLKDAQGLHDKILMQLPLE